MKGFNLHISNRTFQMNNGQVEMPISDLAKGVYFARINQTETIKVVK
jgi:hypothetical protein